MLAGDAMAARCALFALFAIVLMTSLVSSWPYDDDYSAWRLARSSRRSHHCTGSGSKCFSTAECCRGFVCAAFDDYFGQRGPRTEGMNPEIPGFCVKEKDLQPCYATRDCPPDAKCVSLGRDGESYCVRRPRSSIEDLIEELPVISVPSANQIAIDGSGKGGLGAKCDDNSDCQPFEKPGGAQLCCQRVSRGRQGIKRICDRVTAISKCIAG